MLYHLYYSFLLYVLISLGINFSRNFLYFLLFHTLIRHLMCFNFMIYAFFLFMALLLVNLAVTFILSLRQSVLFKFYNLLYLQMFRQNCAYCLFMCCRRDILRCGLFMMVLYYFILLAFCLFLMSLLSLLYLLFEF